MMPSLPYKVNGKASLGWEKLRLIGGASG